MRSIADGDQLPQEPPVDLCRLLHPSSGLPRRVVLALVGEAAVEEPAAAEPDEHVAEVLRLDAVPAFVRDRADRRRRRHRHR